MRMLWTSASNLSKDAGDTDKDPSLAWTRDGKVYNKGKGVHSPYSIQQASWEWMGKGT